MQNSPQPAMRGKTRIQRIAAGIALLLLAGCGVNGDFGEVRNSLVRDDIHDWVGRDANVGGPAPMSNFELTDDERQLRDLAFPLIQPAYDRRQWYNAAGEYGLIGADHRGGYDRTQYATWLFTERHRSPASRYAQLIDDIRSDITRLPQFFETASRVLDIDRKREKSLAYISGLGPAERNDALRRVRENAAIVGMVQASLNRRAESYGFAMERLVLMAPSPQAVEVERSLNQLRGETAKFRFSAPPGRSRGQVANARQ